MVRPGIRDYFRLRPRSAAEIAAEVDEELALHLELRTQELMARGMAADAARQEAERRFGVSSAARTALHRRAEEREHGITMSEWLAGWRQDFTFSARALARQPLLAGMVVLTLALGIGANATIFGIVDQLLLRDPAHIVEPERVQRIHVTTMNFQSEVVTSARTGYNTAMLLRELDAFEGVAAYDYKAATRIGRGRESMEEWTGWATANLFPLLGVRPALGRFFTEEEDRPHVAERVAVLEYGYWRSVYGGAPEVLGQTIVIADQDYTIIGVTPRGFTGPELSPAKVWLPFSTGDQPTDDWPTTWNAMWLNVLVRLKPDVTPARAEAEASAALRAAAAEANRKRLEEAQVILRPATYTNAGVEPPEVGVTRWLAGVSMIVLLIACANVVNLLLARGVRRRREVAVRLALGVSRARLARLLMSETMLLAVAGGILALAFASWSSDVLRAALLPDIMWDSPLNVRVLLFSAAIVLLTTVLVGLAPVLQAARQDVTVMLKANSRQGGAVRSSLQPALTVVQTAFTLVLLVGATLFVRSLWNVRSLDLGVEADRVVSVWTRFPDIGELPQERQEAERVRRRSAVNTVAEQLNARPEVEHAAIANSPPLRGTMTVLLEVPGWDSLPQLPGGGPYVTAASPRYFETVGTRLVRGRGFREGEGESSEPVAVVNETMARTLWPGQDPLGQCLFVGRTEPRVCSRVVGVAEDTRRWRLVEDPAMQYYVPLGQARLSGGVLLVRPVMRNAAAFVPQLQDVLHQLEPGADHFIISTLDEPLRTQIRPWQLGTTMFMVFGGLALIIAAIGLYSVIAYGVAQRNVELGVRVALGAGTASIIGLVLRRGVLLVLIGIAVGMPLAWIAGGYIEPLLFDVAARDASPFISVAALLLIVAVAASAIPAARAGRVDPIQALRAD